jgi:FkbM family methyltransferase
MPGKFIKRLFVITQADTIVASLAARFQSPILKRLVPGPSYYTNEKRKIVRKGVKFIVHPADLSQWFIFSGNYDTHVQSALSRISPDQSVILDVGANIGHFSLILAEQLRRKGLEKKIIAFEPNPKVYQLLLKNIRLNPRLKRFIEVNPVALGDTPTIMRISVPRRNSGAGTLTSTYHDESHDDFFVRLTTLDDHVSLSVEFIKIDVEGFEYPVLVGATQTLKKYRPAIYVETHPAHKNYHEVLSFLTGLGYTLLNEQGQPLDVAGVTGLVNVLAISE